MGYITAQILHGASCQFAFNRFCGIICRKFTFLLLIQLGYDVFVVQGNNEKKIWMNNKQNNKMYLCDIRVNIIRHTKEEIFPWVLQHLMYSYFCQVSY